MSYEWSNAKRLSRLKVEGDSGILHFELGDESVNVYLSGDRDIHEVVHKNGSAETRISRDECSRIIVGSEEAEREVFHYLLPGGPSPSLRLGITKHNIRGGWSSLPHDFELNPELGFEEAFFYMLDGGSREAIQVGKGVWRDGTEVSDVWKVRDSTFGTIPMGYHPVVGEPGVSVHYVWIYDCIHPHWEKI